MSEIYTYHGTKGTIRITEPAILGENETVIDMTICATRPDNISLSIYYQNDPKGRVAEDIIKRYQQYGFEESEFNGLSGDPLVSMEGNVQALEKRTPKGLIEKLAELKGELEKYCSPDENRPKYVGLQKSGSFWDNIGLGNRGLVR